MNKSVDKRSDAASIRIAIQAYARQLRETLGTYMGVTTQSADLISRNAYQEATLRHYDPQEHREWNGQCAAPNVVPPLSEATLLAEWRKENYRTPLLIVAPAGSGKSCLLESVALEMANDLLNDDSRRQSDLCAVGVPLLISLSKMKDAPLNDYLPNAEKDLTARTNVKSCSAERVANARAAGVADRQL